MKTAATLLLFISVLAGLLFNSCHNTPFIPTMPQVSFSKDVYPIIVGNCTESGCHTQGGQHGGEGFSMSGYDDVISFGEITAGNANKSRLYNALTGNGESLMPKEKQLPDAQVLTIYLWIEQGAQNN